MKQWFNLSARALVCALATVPARSAGVLAGVVLFVAPNGDDASPGTRSKPFATLAKARDAARAAKAADAAHKPRIVVRGGKYFLDTPLEFTADDSGLTIEAAPREKPVLYGGRRITGWQKDGEMFWSAKLPATPQPWEFRMLVVDGAFCPRARLPETGTFTHLTEFKVRWMSTSGGGWQRKPTEEELTTMKFRPGEMGPWLDVRSAELTIYHMWDESLVGVASLDDATQTVKFISPSGHPPGAFGVKKYVIWNVRNGLRRPGQWYQDRSAGRVVYWPLPGQDMTKADVIAPTVESIIRLRGTKAKPIRNVTLRGLTMSVTNTPLKSGGFGAGRFDGAVQVENAGECRFENLTIERAGGQGIKVAASAGVRVEDCHVRETGAGGIRVHGQNNVIVNNRVHHVGLTYPSAIAVSTGGSGNLISHNEVHHTPYSAVTAGGNDHRIEHNLIYNTMQELHDGAGIYITFCTNVVVRGNVVRDIVDTGRYGASAYYLDEQARDCLVESNLSVGVNWPVHLHMATDNTVRANVFVVDGNAKVSMARTTGAVFDRNIFHATGDILFRCATNGIAAMPNNIFFSGTGNLLWEPLQDYSSKGKAPLELRDGSVMTDPLFMDPKRGDFRFRPGSPATRIRVKPLDPRQAGPSKQ